MAYRNGTYVAFHAQGTSQPGKSDMDYYRLLTAWSAKTGDDFAMLNSHDKASAVRDTSKRETLRASLLERLRNSKNLVLIIGESTRFDTDWVPFEISKAVDTYMLPIIAAYTDGGAITRPSDLRYLWPDSLAARIDARTARVVHIPFKKEPIKTAIDQFTHDKLPEGGLVHYTESAYRNWGLL